MSSTMRAACASSSGQRCSPGSRSIARGYHGNRGVGAGVRTAREARMVHKNIQALGALSVLALGHRAEAGSGEGQLEVTFAVVKKKGALVLETYAKNTSATAVMVDDDPFVRSATLTNVAGGVTALQPMNSAEMFTRAGPRRHWVSVQAGEKLLVGTTPLEGRV